jgi:hypothetical protein
LVPQLLLTLARLLLPALLLWHLGAWQPQQQQLLINKYTLLLA